MLKILAAILLATSTCVGPAAAAGGGGGGAEPVPSTNYTDLPSYHPTPAYPRVWMQHARNHVPWRQSSFRGN